MAGKSARIVGFNGFFKPIFTDIVKTNKNFVRHFHSAMLYAHYELSSLDLKKEVIKYIKSLDAKHPFLDRIKPLNENRLAVFGKYMYLLNHGADIPDKVSAILLSSLEKTIVIEEAKEKKLKAKIASEPEQVAVVKDTVSIQDRMKDKVRDVAAEIEGWIDDQATDTKTTVKTIDDFVNLFKANDLKGPHMRIMKVKFETRAAEFQTAALGKDKELSEGYSNFTKPELKKMAGFYENLLKATDMLQEVAKVRRAPKKKKPVSHEKLVARLKYKKEDQSLGIVSQNPVHIIGAKEVWVYNTKTRKLAQLKALDERGLLVKGASIDNISSDSKEKTVRKPVETLADFKKATKIKLRTFMQDLGTLDVPAQGKLNENHIILRIDK